MTTVFSNFTSGLRTSYPKLDVLIWLAGLAMYKSFGYRTKLYCTKEDLGFLDKNLILGLYDEVDVDFLSKEASKALSGIDGKRFWSARKLECLRHEWVDLGHADSVYSDVDVVMNVPFSMEGLDALAWSPEKHQDVSIYMDWDLLSSPKGYERPDYIASCDDAVNCGVLWIRNKGTFLKWYREYHRWADGNPCMVSVDAPADCGNNAFACNSEQRILKAVLLDDEAKAGFVMDEQGRGLGPNGSHWYFYRALWRNLKSRTDAGIPIDGNDPCMVTMNVAADVNLGILKAKDPKLFKAVSGQDWLKGFSVGSEGVTGALSSYD